MTQSSRVSHTARLRPSLLGVGVTFAAFLTLANSTSPLLALDTNNWSIVTGCLIGIIIASLMIQLIKRIAHAAPITERPAAISLLSLLGFVFVCIGMLLSVSLPLVAGMCAGCGLLIVMTIWSVYYARLMPEESLVNASIALGISGVLYPLCFLPFVSELPFVYACVLLLISVVLQIRAGLSLSDSALSHSSRSKHPSAQNSTESKIKPASSDALEKASAAQRVKDMLTALWKPLLSAMIAAFILGLVHNPRAADSMDDFALVSHPLMSIGAPLLAAALVLIAYLVWKKNFTLHVFANVVVPVAVSLLLIIPMIKAEQLWLNILTTLLSHGSFALIALATWVAVANSVRTSGTSAWTIFTTASALLAAATLLGIVLVHYIGKGGQLLSLILLTAFLLLMVVDFAIHDKSRSVERELQQDVFDRFLKSRCESLTERYKLTARESEILPYLARGYSHVYTAQELYVSENTIRTHVKHIYTKLGVSSREELITLIDTHDMSGV